MAKHIPWRCHTRNYLAQKLSERCKYISCTSYGCVHTAHAPRVCLNIQRICNRWEYIRVLQVSSRNASKCYQVCQLCLLLTSRISLDASKFYKVCQLFMLRTSCISLDASNVYQICQLSPLLTLCVSLGASKSFKVFQLFRLRTSCISVDESKNYKVCPLSCCWLRVFL